MAPSCAVDERICRAELPARTVAFVGAAGVAVGSPRSRSMACGRRLPATSRSRRSSARRGAPVRCAQDGTELDVAKGSRADRLKTFIEDASQLGTLRFINMSDGAVLETVGRFDYTLKYTPMRGGVLSVVSPDSLFEMHVLISKLASITLSKEKAKMGDHDMYVIRLRRADDGLMLSCVLQWNPSEGAGNYFPGAVECFSELVNKYGERVDMSDGSTDVGPTSA